VRPEYIDLLLVLIGFWIGVLFATVYPYPRRVASRGDEP
jgi:hypothetical protein